MAVVNMAVERQDGTAIDFSSALRRSFAVWLRGALGGGLPVVSLIAMVLAWNRDGGFVVRHGEVGFWRSLAACRGIPGHCRGLAGARESANVSGRRKARRRGCRPARCGRRWFCREWKPASRPPAGR